MFGLLTHRLPDCGPQPSRSPPPQPPAPGVTAPAPSIEAPHAAVADGEAQAEDYSDSDRENGRGRVAEAVAAGDYEVSRQPHPLSAPTPPCMYSGGRLAGLHSNTPVVVLRKLPCLPFRKPAKCSPHTWELNASRSIK